MKNRKAFTLVELLVVVAIIAVLIALLLPQIAKAKEYAKMTKCAANMHAIGIGLATYAGNNNGFVIDAWDTQRNFGQGVKTSNWSDRLIIDGEITQSIDPTMDTPAEGRGVFQCPNHDKYLQFLLPGQPSATAYDGYGIPWWASSHWEYLQLGTVWIKRAGMDPDMDANMTTTNSAPGGEADSHLFYSRKLSDLIANNIYVVEGNSGIEVQVGGTWAYWIYLRHFNRLLNGTASAGSPPTYSSKQYTYSGKANYMMADFHVEVNSWGSVWTGSPATDPQSWYDKYPAYYGSGGKRERSPFWHPDN